MNYRAFTKDSLAMFYESARMALEADMALTRRGAEPRFRVRETAEWRTHASDLETEMLKRGMFFEIIDWTEARNTHPFECPANVPLQPRAGQTE